MKQKILLMLALWLSLVGSTWAQSTSIAVTITKTDASVINSSGASLQETLEATTPGEVKKLDITAGSFTAADWQWLLDNKSALVSLTHFTITEGVSEVSNTRQTFNSIFNSNIELVNLYGITEIKNDDFRNCQFLSSVSFPSVTSIGNSAFYECTALSSVSFPVARSIGNLTFVRCSALDTVSFPDVTSIGTSAFYECGNLISVSFPKVSSIGRYDFCDCLALRSVSFPVATSIGESAFEGCQSLSSFNFDGVISIGSYAFKKSALVSISLPEATSIGNHAFWLCESLISVSCPKITSIEAGTFQGCQSLSSVSIPMATSIASEAFFSCQSLSSVSFPRAASIGSRAFQYCFFLNDMLLGALLPSISGFDHFGNCPPTRYLAFADADGNLLTGVELENARAAYKAVDDGSTSDNLWHGWDISRNLYVPSIDPAIVNGSLTAGNPDAELFGGYPAGATIFITSSPATSYRLKPGSLRVYKTGAETVEVPLTGNSFTMPDFEVTVTAEFEPLPLQVTFVAENAGNIPIGLLLESGSGRIVVDKGDGVLVPYDIDSETSSFYITSYVAGNTVKIYSDNITELAFQCILTALDVSRVATLTQLSCPNSRLNFATLPQPKSSYTEYEYIPQQNLAATCTNGVVDLSSQLTAIDKDGNTQTTAYKWFLANETELTNNFIPENGVFRFVLDPGTVVYCTMTNAAFPGLTLRSTDITVDAKVNPNIALISENTGNLSFYVQWDGAGENIAYVDWGNGILMSYTDNTISTSTYVAGNTVKVYGENINYFDVNSQGLTALDLSNITTLTSLFCNTNKLSSLDVSQNTGLTYISCYDNNLGSLDVSQNTQLETLYCYGNKLKFTSLPQRKSSYSNYEYAPQQNLAATCTSGVVDLSAQLTAVDVDGNTQITTYSWFLANGTYLQKGTDYAEGNGVFFFTKLPEQAVYCEMTNAAFSDLTLRTDNIFIDAKATMPEPNITFVSEKNGSLSFIANNSQAGKVYVDWGDGVLTAYNVPVDGNQLSTSSYTANNTAKVYGANISQLYIFSAGLTALDVTKCTSLTRLDCFSNKLASLDLTQNSALTSLSCSENMLTSIDLSHNTGLTHLNCKNNKLTALDVSSNTNLSNFFCFGNELTFNSLPQVKTNYDTYAYAPQANLAATCTNGLIDLSSQLTATDANGNTQNTAYAWYLADGTALTEDVDYKRSGGIFFFLKQPARNVYCTMTNAAFPDLDLRTVDITVDKTLEVNISFVSEKNGEIQFYVETADDSPILIDWGNGSLLAKTNTYNGVVINTSSYMSGDTVKIYGETIDRLDVSGWDSDLSEYTIENQIVYLNVSQASNLINLFCENNNLTALDVSKNADLNTLWFNNNNLSNIDVSHNTSLERLIVNDNRLSFATLPQPKSSYTAYEYVPQQNLAATCTNGVVDLSSQLTAIDKDGNTQTTEYKWFLANETELTNNFIPENGVFRFVLDPGTVVYCTMTNAAFPGLTLRTENITIDAKATLPEPTITLVSELSGGINFSVDVTESSTIYIDWGDGVLMNYAAVSGTYIYPSTSSYVANSTVKVYGSKINDIYIDNRKLSALDISNASLLTDLTCENNLLEHLDVSNNVLLTKLNCSTNKISRLDVRQNIQLEHLYSSYNLLNDIDLSNNSKLTMLFLAYNNLSDIDVRNNLLLSRLSLGGNRLTFSNLPQAKEAYGENYLYASQQRMIAASFNGVVDLSSQLTAVDKDGNTQTTAYTWYTQSGTALTAGTDYSEAGGVFTFNNELVDSVFCEMTNSAFPALTLQTVNLKISFCTNPTAGGAISGDQAICYGDTPAIFESTELPSGETGTIEYKWQASTEGNSAGFVDIESSNAETYAPGALTATTWYKRLAKVTCTSDWAGAVESNVVEVVVNTLPDAPTVPANQNTYIYDGLPKTLAGVVGLGESIFWYDAETGGNSISAPVATNVGTYSAWAETKNDATACTSATRSLLTLTIEKATLTVTVHNQTKVYGDSNPELTFSYSGWMNNDDENDLDEEPVAVTTIDELSNAGLYVDLITFTGGYDNNYKFDFVPGDFEITKATLTVTAHKQTKVYGENNPMLTFSYSGWVNGEESIDVTPIISTTINALSNAGNYNDAITFTGGSDNNYLFSFVAGDFEITKTKLTVTADNKTKFYGESNPVLTFKYDGFVNNDNASDLDDLPIISTTIDEFSGAGFYPDSIILKGGLDNNYELELVSGDFNIKKATLTVTADNKNRLYGRANPELTFSYSGFFAEEDASILDVQPEVSTLASKDSDVGSYEIIVSGGSDDNYDMLYRNGKLNIEQGNLNIFAEDKTVRYGDSIPELTLRYEFFDTVGTVSGLDHKITAWVNTDSITGPGTYPIHLSGGKDDNYAIFYFEGTLTIEKALLKVTAQDKSITYGEPLPELTYTIEGFLNGDKDSVLTSMPTIAAATGAGENAGVFAIMPSGGSDEFYDFDYQNGKLMVAKAMLTATASDMVSSVGTIPQLTVGYAGFVKGDTSSELDTLPVATTTATKDSPSGEYPISVSGGYDNNYNFTYIGGELTLASKATPTITWNTPSDMVYGELLSEKQLNATCNAYGTFVYEPAAGTLLGAGDMKELKVTFEPFDTININKVSKIVYVDVQKAVLTVKANDKIVNYGDTLPVWSFSYSGFINDENAGVLDVLPTITSIDGVVEAGTYPIVVSGGADNNYIFEYENGTLTVKPRLNPVVIWENPSSITYGTELSQVQLNAKTDVAGTFVYTPSAGTVFEAGELQPIIVQFTPADTLTYAVVTDTAFVSVYKATLTVTANDVEMNAGETVPEFTLSYSGFVNGDDELDIDKLPVASSTVKSATIKSVYEITVSGGQDNNYGFVYKSGNLIVNSGVGVDAMKSVSMLVYPNPFTDQVSITSDYKGVGSYQLSDITGKVIEQGNIANGTGNLKLSHIRSGVYLLQVKLGEGNKTFRIVKQ